MVNFPSTFTEENIKEIVSPYGTVTKVILKVPEDKTKPAAAFVVFEKESEANEAISQLNGKPISELTAKVEEKKESEETKPESSAETQKNDNLRVSIYYTRKERNIHKKKLRRESRLKNLYIRNFPHYFDTEDLRELFKPFGGIVSCVVMKSSEGISRGFGFCSFENIQQAQSAYIQLNGKQLPVKKDNDSTEQGTVELYVNYAIPREDFMRQTGKTGAPGAHGMLNRQRGHAQNQQRPAYGSAGPNGQQFGYPTNFQGFAHPFMYGNSPNAMGGTPRQGFDANVASPPVQMAQGMPYGWRQGYPTRRMPQQPFFFPMGNRGMWNPALMYPQHMMYANINRGMYSPNFTQSPPSAMTQPSAGSPYGAIMASNGSPSSAGPATGSPGSSGAMHNLHSPVGGHQSSPASGGQPGTPTSASAPSSPASSGTGSLNASPSSGPHNIFVHTAHLQNMSVADQRNSLGEALFTQISHTDGARGGKMTAMLVELEANELIRVGEDKAELQSKVQETQHVLQEAEAQPHNYSAEIILPFLFLLFPPPISTRDYYTTFFDFHLLSPFYSLFLSLY